MKRRDGLWLCGDCWSRRYETQKFEQAKLQATIGGGSHPWGDSLPLAQGEQIIDWGADYSEVLDPESWQLGPKGFLVLTSQRLAFIPRPGALSNISTLLYSSALEYVNGVSVGKNRLVVMDRSGKREFTRTGAQVLAPKISEAIARRKQDAESKRQSEKVQLVLDFTFLKAYLEKGGLALQAIKCTNCGAPMKLPENGTVVTCTNCTTTHYAQDVFEKIRQLL